MKKSIFLGKIYAYIELRNYLDILVNVFSIGMTCSPTGKAPECLLRAKTWPIVTDLILESEVRGQNVSMIFDLSFFFFRCKIDCTPEDKV